MPYFGLIMMALWVFCLIDVITADESEIRYLPKMVWLLLVLFIPLVGSIVWLLAGRPIGGGVWGGSGPQKRGSSAFSDYEARPARAMATTSEADAEFRAQCRARAEEQRRKAREQ